MLIDHVARYQILEIPASGTFGVVCIAQDSSGRKVAIKVLHHERGADPASLHRARDEARLLSRLQHPNLVQVDPILQVNGRPCLVMEYVEGLTLSQLIEHAEPVPVDIALTMIRDAAAGLDAAWATPSGSTPHPMRVVHRDIKPGNIMIDVHGCVKVVDFGLAKAVFSDRESQSAVFVPSSRGYMAPERLEGLDTPKGDVYGLGITLFELLAKTKPVVSLRMSKHDTSLAEAWDRLVGETDDRFPISDLRGLVLSMCAYEDDHRPYPGEVVTAVTELLARGDANPDLFAYANAVVRPLHEARPIGDPRSHPEYRDLLFLERAPSTKAGRFDPHQEVRRFVDSQDFTERWGEVAALLTAHPQTDLTPLLELLDGAAAAPWEIWKKRPTQGRTIAALRALSTATSPPVLQRVRRLARHKDPEVARTARQILDRAP